MPKADKLPTVDPMQPDVYMAILRAVDIERKRRNSSEYRKRMELEAQIEGDRTKAVQRESAKERQEREADVIWAARIRALSSFGNG